jgi:hypothetical protein
MSHKDGGITGTGDPNVRALPQVETDKLRAAVEKMRRTLPLLIEYYQIDAKIRKARYEALIAEGFNPAQALELCK